MKTIQVTVYLKSGGNATTEIRNTTMKYAKNMYYEAFHSGEWVMFHEDSDGKSTQVIPIDNIACVNLKEVSP